MRKLKSKERSDKKQMRNIEQVNNIKQIKNAELKNSKEQIQKAKQEINTRVSTKIDRKIVTEIVKSQKGITLLVLVITIIILLILSGITIGAITGENGIIQNAENAKEQAEIDNEREVLEKAVVQIMGNNKYGNIEEDELQEQLNKEIGQGKTDAADIGDEFEVIFNESKRYYTIDKNGNVGNAQEIIKDNYPGDFTVNEKGEILDGKSKEEGKPYEISCIEDLVVLSNLSRGKGNYMGNGEIKKAEKNTFSGKYFILTKTLNFNSKVSYADLSMGWRYDEEENAYVIDETSTQNLRELLIDISGVGFVPISEDTGSGNLMFAGNLDGQNYEIQNLYENTENAGGLFLSMYRSIIKNLGLTNINITANKASGISRRASGCKFYNVYISGNIYCTASGQIGGIVGSVYGNIDIINCCNLTNLKGKGRIGGLISYDDINGTTTTVNSYNLGELTELGNGVSGGIIGGVYNTGTRNIINTCSVGKINSTNSGGYNFYTAWGGATVSLSNCYYLDTIIDENVTINENSISFYKGDKTIINSLNNYVEEHKNDYISEGITLYNWKLDNNGLPTFDK